MASLVTTLQGYDLMCLSDRDRRTQVSTCTLSQRDLLSGRTWVDVDSETPVVRAMVPSRSPRWVQPTVESLAALLALPSGWNSYDARTVKPSIAQAAFELLADVMDGDTPGPSIVPTSAGGLQLEWHTANVELEITFYSSRRAEVYCEDVETGQSWEGSLWDCLGRLQDALAKLARRS
jgi:hypothetical protein